MADKQTVENIPKSLELMPLSEAAKLSGYTPEYLNLLSRKGKLQAVKIGRNWYTKKQWLDELMGGNEETKKTDGQKLSGHEAERGSVACPTTQTSENRIGFSTRTKITLSDKTVGDKQADTRKNDANISFRRTSGWLKVFASLSSAAIIMPLAFAITFAMKNYFRSENNNSEFARLVAAEVNESKILNENDLAGRVAGEETTNAGISIVAASENFKVSDINVGGDILTLANGENKELEIENIKSESFMSGKGDEVKLVISWQTNKMASSELAISKNDGQVPESVKENSFGFSHSAVVPGLDQGTSYVYQIKCKDRWANEKTSDFFGIYTSSKPVSVFELIANALGEVFGWAVKK